MVKEELIRHIGSGRHCKIAELAAIFTFCGSLDRDIDGKISLHIQTENEVLARKSFTLLKKTFNIETDVSNSQSSYFSRGNLYCIAVTDSVKVREILVEHIREKSDFLLSNMAFFFIPAGVSMINYLDILIENLVPILVISVVSTFITFIAAALSIRLTLKLMNGGKHHA